MFRKIFCSREKKDHEPVRGPVEYIIAGLGNPGKEYENTRHNTGYLAIETIAKERGVKMDKLKYKSLCGECMISGKRVFLMKPATFMNLSGEAVRDAMSFYKVPPERTIIIFDDVSLEQGRLRIRKKGSDGGHNGIKNIIYLTGSDDFPRIKIGIGGKPEEYDLKDWVLEKFSEDDEKIMQESYRKASQAVELMIEGKYDEAMNKYNR
ncbi:MAG: aminoacyl-tRNA hydrolase [Oscillospiraceae bacterium]|nr:aminoacyl-tRNA hydrolase [Oscillospiraceae bacterium]